MESTSLHRLGSVAVFTAGLGLCLAAAAVTVSGSTSESPWLEALARMLMVAVPIAVGAYALHRPPFERFGRLLIFSGLGWFLTTLANSGNPVLYSVGRIAGWGVEPVLMYLLLSFPTGRLTSRLDRALVATTALLVLALYLPTALVVEGYAVPAPWMSCSTDCPANAFMVSGSEPAIVEELIRPLREALTFALFAAVAVRLGQRIHGANPLTRRMLVPVLGVACLRCALFSAAVLGRRLAPDAPVVEVATWLIALTVPLTALAFLVGLARWWLFLARATQQLATRLRGHPGPEDLRVALAEAFADPTLRIVYWLGNGDGQWGDARGEPLREPLVAAGGCCVTEIRDGERRVAAIIHDSAFQGDRTFIDTASTYALMTLNNHRLSAQTSLLLRQVRESRGRIQAAADQERQRIERDLHDGAQQRLVAIRIKLELAAEQTGDEDGETAAVLRGLGDDVEEALEEVRSLAHGIYPAPLADRGLVEGLRAAALRNPLPTTVLAAGVGRYSREVESAAYFCCLEALQNASKHARGASGVVVELADNGALRAEVRDDGAGFDPAFVNGGVGLTSMRDRLAAVGGELAIISRPGHGTRVTASIPLGATGAGDRRSTSAAATPAAPGRSG